VKFSACNHAIHEGHLSVYVYFLLGVRSFVCVSVSVFFSVSVSVAVSVSVSVSVFVSVSILCVCQYYVCVHERILTQAHTQTLSHKHIHKHEAHPQLLLE